MDGEIDKIEAALTRLRDKQRLVDDAWRKTGNRELLEFFVELMPKALAAERCSIFILDPKSEHVWLHSGTGVKQREIEVPIRGSLVGEVIASGKAEMRHKMDQTMGTHGRVDQQTGFITYNALVVPIKGVSKVDTVVGAIQVLNKKPGLQFNADDQALLEKLAYHLQMQIENIYLRQELLKISLEMSEKIRLLEGRLVRAKLHQRGGGE